MKDMKQIKIPYKNTLIKLQIPENRLAGILRSCNQVPGKTDEIIRQALSHPVGSKPIEQMIASRPGRFCCIVNDADRATPTAKVLDQVQKRIGTLDFDVLVATGTHRPPTDAEMRRILGKFFLPLRDRCFFHDCHEDAALLHLGFTSRGTPVNIHKKAVEADGLLIIGSVEPHYFAGFTGGRKSILPGIAGFSSVEQNHKLVLHPNVDPLRLAGNPVHEDMMEAVGFLKEKPIHSIQLVLDADDRVVAASAGDLWESFEIAVEKCRNIYGIPLEESVDILIAVATPPLDKNLYQAHKAIENTKNVLRKNGTLILVAPCYDGIGNDTFVRLLGSSPRPEKIIETIRSDYHLGYHKAARIAELSQKAALWAVTELDSRTLQSCFMEKKESLQEAVDEAMQQHREGKVLIVQAATTTIPTLKK